MWKILNSNSGGIQALFAILLFIITTAYVVINYYMKKEMDKTRLREIRPVMSLKFGLAVPEKEEYGYPIHLYFENTGKGTAYISAIDANRKDVNIDLGVPTNVGPEKQTDIKIWLGETDKSEEIKTAYYYYDIDENCYRTELHVILRHYDKRTNPKGGSQLFFVKYQMVKPVHSKNEKMPNQLLYWRKDRELFAEAWWNKASK